MDIERETELCAREWIKGVLMVEIPYLHIKQPESKEKVAFNDIVFQNASQNVSKQGCENDLTLLAV
jgi:hypothetical protein